MENMLSTYTQMWREPSQAQITSFKIVYISNIVLLFFLMCFSRAKQNHLRKSSQSIQT